MLTIRIDTETEKMIAYLRIHKVRFQPKLREAIKDELTEMCNDFKMRESKAKLPF